MPVTSKPLRAALCAGALAMLAACGSPPVVHLHSLMPSAAAPAGGRAASAPIVVVIDPIRVPVQVDQPQWLVELGDGSLASLEQERWASPLRDELQQAVLETLIDRYGAVELRHVAGGGAGATAATATRIGIDVRRFESVPGREARIAGSWTLTSVSPSSSSPSPLPRATHCEWSIREPAPGTVGSLADAHRRAVARLANGIGDALVATRQARPMKCPADAPPT